MALLLSTFIVFTIASKEVSISINVPESNVVKEELPYFYFVIDSTYPSSIKNVTLNNIQLENNYILIVSSPEIIQSDSIFKSLEYLLIYDKQRETKYYIDLTPYQNAIRQGINELELEIDTKALLINVTKAHEYRFVFAPE